MEIEWRSCQRSRLTEAGDGGRTAGMGRGATRQAGAMDSVARVGWQRGMGGGDARRRAATRGGGGSVSGRGRRNGPTTLIEGPRHT